MTQVRQTTTVFRQRAVMTRALLLSAARLGLSWEQLGAATGLTQAEINALDCGGRLDPRDPRWQACVLVVRLCRALADDLPGDESLVGWMTTFNRELGAVPAELLVEPDGLEALVAYLERPLVGNREPLLQSRHPLGGRGHG